MDIITLFEELMSSIFDAEEKFIENPKDFYSLEKSVKTSTENFAAKYLGVVLPGVNKQICESGWRDGRYAS